MSNALPKLPMQNPDGLIGRVVSILEQAQGNVVRAVNTQMVAAYWLIGREIVLELQGGEERAEYGKQLLSELSIQLTKHYGSGFSVPNLQNFRKFYLAYISRSLTGSNIQYPMGTKSVEGSIQHPLGMESSGALGHSENSRPRGVDSAREEIRYQTGTELVRPVKTPSPKRKRVGFGADADPLACAF